MGRAGIEVSSDIIPGGPGSGSDRLNPGKKLTSRRILRRFRDRGCCQVDNRVDRGLVRFGSSSISDRPGSRHGARATTRGIQPVVLLTRRRGRGPNAFGAVKVGVTGKSREMSEDVPDYGVGGDEWLDGRSLCSPFQR